MRLNTSLVVIILLVVINGIFGCSPASVDSSSTGTISPPGNTTTSTPSAMLVTAGTTSLGTGQQTNLVAYVVDNIGHPVANATVSFSMDSALKGSLSAATAITDSLGQATVAFTAGTTVTTVVITSAVGSVSDTESINIGGGGGGTVTVVPTQSNISTGSTTTITAMVKNSSGSLVSNTVVNFSLSSNNATLSSTSAITDSAGQASIGLTGVNAGTVQVTAASTTYGSGNTSVTVTANATDSLTLTTTASSILTNATTTISALLSGPSFTTASSYTVNFSVSNPSIATLSVASADTTNGIAVVALKSTAITGTVTVTATYAGLPSLTNSTAITVTAPPPDNVTVSANPTSITVYGTATISAIVTANSYSVPDGTSVSFIVSDSTYGSLSAGTVSTVNGKATTTFTASNKAGTILITAVAGSVSNNTSLPINPATTGSIQFVSASLQLLNLKTAGTDPISTITFAVKDVNGNPATEGTQVTFNMNGPGGGEYIGSIISSTTATSSTVNGSASVTLHSGTVAGPVTIVATTEVSPGVTISTSATQVSIGGGVPSAKHWNLATSQFNLAGLKTSGLEATITAYIGDRFGNYNIPAGTVVSFYTEAGKIDTQGTTDGTGKATVTLRTQDPIPVDVDKLTGEPWYTASSLVGHPTTTYNPRDGRVTVLATTQGEEMFLDENGDGLFSKGIGTSACPAGYTCECSDGSGGYVNSVTTGVACSGGNLRSEAFFDLSEPFYDKNDDGCRNDVASKNCNGSVSPSDEPFEEFIDANKNGIFDGPNGKWDGPGCTTLGCQTSKMIWKDIKVVFTGDYYFWPMPDGGNCYSTPSLYTFLSSGVTSTATTISVGSTTGFNSSGRIKIDSELIDYTGTSAGSFTGCTRAVGGTTAASHTFGAYVYDQNGSCTASYSAGSFALAPANITKGTAGSFTVIIGDVFLNSLPGGTKIAASASEGTVTPDSVTLLDGLSGGPTWFSFVVDVPESSSKSVTTVSVSVDDGPPATLTIPLIDPLTITTTTLSDGTVSSAYSQTLVASGGTAPYTWSIASGSLPTGLTLNAGTGAITGTPSAAGTFNLTVQVMDNSSATAAQALSITINP